MDRFPLARDQRHAVLAQGHQHRLAIGELHRVLRASAMLLSLSARLRVASANSLRWRQQRCAAIDRKIGALGSTITRLPSFRAASMTFRNHARRQHALG